MARDVPQMFLPRFHRSAAVSDREIEFQSLTRAVRHGTVPWTVKGYLQARMIVRRARSGEIRLPQGPAGVPPDLLEEAEMDQVALGLWLRREHGHEPPEVPAAHHLRFHAIEEFLERNADLLLEEGLLRREDAGLEPSPLLLIELVARPYDRVLTTRQTPGFDLSDVLKAVARRAR
jgi:hypothetical protein